MLWFHLLFYISSNWGFGFADGRFDFGSFWSLNGFHLFFFVLWSLCRLLLFSVFYLLFGKLWLSFSLFSNRFRSRLSLNRFFFSFDLNRLFLSNFIYRCLSLGRLRYSLFLFVKHLLLLILICLLLFVLRFLLITNSSSPVGSKIVNSSLCLSGFWLILLSIFGTVISFPLDLFMSVPQSSLDNCITTFLRFLSSKKLYLYLLGRLSST